DVLELDLLRAVCRSHFWPFFMHAWGTMHGPHARDWWIDRAEIAEPLAAWFETQIHEWQQARAAHKKTQRHLMVIVAREFGKTTLITQAGLLWLHLQDPDLSCFIGSEKVELAAGMLSAIRAVLTGTDKHAQWTRLYGDWIASDGIARKTAIVHTHRSTTTRKEPSFGVWGVETGLTGSHPDVLCLDDPNTYERAAADVGWYERVVQHCASLTPVVRADGLVIYVGTPYSDADHLHKTLKRDGIATLTGMPMVDFRPRADGRWHVFHLPGRDARGAPTVPNVWSEQRMQEFEHENTDKYSAQILLRPDVSEHNPLTLNLSVFSCSN